MTNNKKINKFYWWLIEAQNKYPIPRWLNNLIYWIRENT